MIETVQNMITNTNAHWVFENKNLTDSTISDAEHPATYNITTNDQSNTHLVREDVINCLICCLKYTTNYRYPYQCLNCTTKYCLQCLFRYLKEILPDCKCLVCFTPFHLPSLRFIIPLIYHKKLLIFLKLQSQHLFTNEYQQFNQTQFTYFRKRNEYTQNTQNTQDMPYETKPSVSTAVDDTHFVREDAARAEYINKTICLYCFIFLSKKSESIQKCYKCLSYVCPHCGLPIKQQLYEDEVRFFPKSNNRVTERSDHICSPQNIDLVAIIKKSCKDCPYCGIIIEQEIGSCDQMFCVICHHTFSWELGKIKGKIIHHNPHFFKFYSNQYSCSDIKQKFNKQIQQYKKFPFIILQRIETLFHKSLENIQLVTQQIEYNKEQLRLRLIQDLYSHKSLHNMQLRKKSGYRCEQNENRSTAQAFRSRSEHILANIRQTQRYSLHSRRSQITQYRPQPRTQPRQRSSLREKMAHEATLSIFQKVNSSERNTSRSARAGAAERSEGTCSITRREKRLINKWKHDFLKLINTERRNHDVLNLIHICLEFLYSQNFGDCNKEIRNNLGQHLASEPYFHNSNIQTRKNINKYTIYTGLNILKILISFFNLNITEIETFYKKRFLKVKQSFPSDQQVVPNQYFIQFNPIINWQHKPEAQDHVASSALQDEGYRDDENCFNKLSISLPYAHFST